MDLPQARDQPEQGDQSDGQCHARTFHAGQPYIGGQELHQVRNESAEPVVMSVTYLNPASGGAPTHRLPAPAGCAA